MVHSPCSMSPTSLELCWKHGDVGLGSSVQAGLCPSDPGGLTASQGPQLQSCASKRSPVRLELLLLSHSRCCSRMGLAVLVFLGSWRRRGRGQARCPEESSRAGVTEEGASTEAAASPCAGLRDASACAH